MSTGLGPGKGPSQSDMAAVANVITVTRDLLKKEDSLVWVMSAMAQRVSADTKIKASIEYVFAVFSPSVYFIFIIHRVGMRSMAVLAT